MAGSRASGNVAARQRLLTEQPGAARLEHRPRQPALGVPSSGCDVGGVVEERAVVEGAHRLAPRACRLDPPTAWRTRASRHVAHGQARGAQRGDRGRRPPSTEKYRSSKPPIAARALRRASMHAPDTQSTWATRPAVARAVAQTLRRTASQRGNSRVSWLERPKMPVSRLGSPRALPCTPPSGIEHPRRGDRAVRSPAPGPRPMPRRYPPRCGSPGS